MDFSLQNIKNAQNIIRSSSKDMPASPGVYKMLDKNANILYIGKAKDLSKRVSSYANITKLTDRIRRMVSQINKIEYIITKSEAQALILEADLVQSIKPKYNVALKDDKSFPYIVIDKKHDYPRIYSYRGKVDNSSGEFFGPYPSASSVKSTILELQKLFLIRPCTDAFFASRQRPCLEYQIKRCAAPCVSKISKTEYAQAIRNAKKFLKGNSTELHSILQKQMEEAAAKQEYEKAAKIRDKIIAINQIQQQNVFATTIDTDFITISKSQDSACIQVFVIRNQKGLGHKSYYHTDVEELSEQSLLATFIMQFYQKKIPPKKIITNIPIDDADLIAKALQELYEIRIDLSTPKKPQEISTNETLVSNTHLALKNFIAQNKKHYSNFLELAKLFNISKSIKRIECYDNSHISGTNPIGAMIVVDTNGINKKESRIFNINIAQPEKGGDDYSMLQEVLRRRLKRLTPSNQPDLMLIDGGKGHLSAAIKILDEFDIQDSQIKLVCISKGPNRNAGREFFHTKDQEAFQLPINDERLRYLQYIRDEVHNFAIKSHRSKREKTLTKSALDSIPGIGKTRKENLLKHFGSVNQLKQAKIKDIEKVSGISKNTAKIIYSYLHNL